MSAIKKGDLVMVIRQHCAGDRNAGKIYTALETFEPVPIHCVHCGTTIADTRFIATHVNKDGFVTGFPNGWLKKIEPLPEKEKEKTQEPIEQA